MDDYTDVKQEHILQHIPPYMDDDSGDEHESGDDSKRPRLRLARACDRCKRRKIKCDTNSPCLPCITAKQQCTFNTPTRRSSKPRPNDKPRKNVKDLEARMASLEQQLRQVPPHVHNAALSKLDASLLNPSELPNAVASSSGTSNVKTGSASSGPPHATDPANPSADLFTAPVPPSGVESSYLARPSLGDRLGTDASQSSVERLEREMSGMNLSPGFIYLDEQGMTKWQGATSGFPLLELLAEAERHPSSQSPNLDPASSASSGTVSTPFSPTSTQSPQDDDRGRTRSSQRDQPNGKGKHKEGGGDDRDRSGSGFFPGRKPRTVQRLDPEASWKAITQVISPDLMDVLIRSYLSTTHLLWPFLHVPSFLADYANPSRWGESGFARFIVAVCTLSSRHVDDPRVRANPSDPSSAGKAYLELFKKMQDLPSADRPTLYSMQASFLAAIYCMGLGTLTTAFRLFAESITMAIDGGLHRDVGAYDIFNPIEREVRKRTFWSIYCWDKQSGACFGRPAMIHLRDCDVSEPIILDDEHITAEGLGEQPEGNKSRICAFVAAIRLHVVLEGVLDGSIIPSDFARSPFLSRAALVIAKRHPQSEALREEEALLEEWVRLLEPHWNYSPETIASKDPIRITQAERLHCLENLVKMLIYRHRFSGFVLTPAETPDERARHLELCRTAMSCALAIVADHLHISQRGYMTYYGVHVIHQLAQAGRTLVAVILNCKSAESRPLIAASIEGFRSCVGLLRRFSGRYICGLRSADILEEFCRICRIPVDSPQVPNADKPSPAWLRPVRKRHSPSPTRRASGPASHLPEQSQSPSVYSSADTSTPPVQNDIFIDPSYDMAHPDHQIQQQLLQQQQQQQQQQYKAEQEDPTIFMGSEFFDINEAAADSPAPTPGASATNGTGNGQGAGRNASLGLGGVNGFNAFGEAASSAMGQDGGNGMFGGMGDMADLGGLPSAGVGMDGLIPGGAGNENLSASEILALLQEGSFDYSELFPDQPMSSSFASGGANTGGSSGDFDFQF